MNNSETLLCFTKAGLNLVPGVGGALASIVSDIQTNRKEKRMDEFLIRLKDELSARSDKIVKEYIMNEEFLDIFENILVDIMNQRLEEKRIQLCNLLVSSIVTPNTSYDRTEEFQMFVYLLSIQHLNVLKVFYQYRDVPMKNMDDIKNIWSSLKKTVSEDEDFLIELIRDLENRGIIHFFLQNTFNCESGERAISEDPYITSKGIDFYQYIELNT